MPTAFISYSWDDPAHIDWVKTLATRLRKDGVDVKLDQWELQPGHQLPHFMECAVRENDFVIVVCTPKYKARSNRRQGGVGYEGDIMTAEILTSGNHSKFIPLHRHGSWNEAAPSWLLGRLYLDFRPESDSDQSYIVLLRTLHGQAVAPPPLGPQLHLNHAEWEQARALLKESQVKDHSASIAELLKQAIQILSNRAPAPRRAPETIIDVPSLVGSPLFGRETEAMSLLSILRDPNAPRKIAISAPPGFGKTGIVVRCLQEIITEFRIQEPGLQGVVYWDCRSKSFIVDQLIAMCQRLSGDAGPVSDIRRMFEQDPHEAVSWTIARVGAQGRSWIFIDNGEDALDPADRLFRDRRIQTFFETIDGRQHPFRFVFASRLSPKNWPTVTRLQEALSAGLPVAAAVSLLRHLGGRALAQESDETVERLAGLARRIPEPLRRLAGFLHRQFPAVTADMLLASNNDEFSSYRELTARHIGLLSAKERQVLGVVVQLGIPVPAEVLTVVDGDKDVLNATCGALVDDGLLLRSQDGDGAIFFDAHSLVRDAISQSQERRSYPHAAQSCIRIADEAISRSQAGLAASVLTCGESFSTMENQRLIRLLILVKRARLFTDMGRWVDAFQSYDAVLATVGHDKHDDLTLHCQALIGKSSLLHLLEDPRALAPAVTAARLSLSACNGRDVMAEDQAWRALVALGDVLASRRRAGQAIDTYRQAVRILRGRPSDVTLCEVHFRVCSGGMSFLRQLAFIGNYRPRSKYEMSVYEARYFRETEHSLRYRSLRSLSRLREYVTENHALIDQVVEMMHEAASVSMSVAAALDPSDILGKAKCWSILGHLSLLFGDVPEGFSWYAQVNELSENNPDTRVDAEFLELQRQQAAFLIQSQQLPAAANRLIDLYAAWSEAPAGTEETAAPHLLELAVQIATVMDSLRRFRRAIRYYYSEALALCDELSGKGLRLQSRRSQLLGLRSCALSRIGQIKAAATDLSAARQIGVEVSMSRVEHAEFDSVLEIASKMLAWVRTIRAILIVAALVVLVLAASAMSTK